ncbi:MAG TPA: hypothetical protein VGC04_11300 [Cellulomonas sp.]
MSDEGPGAEVEVIEPALRVLEHRLTCESVPTQVEGEFIAAGVGRFGYYFRYRFGRWSLEVGTGPELTSEWDQIAAGIGGTSHESRNYDGFMDVDVAIALIDAVLAAWTSRLRG